MAALPLSLRAAGGALTVHLPAALAPVLRYLWGATVASAAQLALLLGPALVLAALMHALSGLIQRHASRYLGGAYYAVFGWLGTAVHELGHALFCLLFGHHVTGIKLFGFSSRDGTLGYVRHSYEGANPYQRVGNFFIGLGPILLGTALLVLAARLLLGAEVFARMHAVPWDARRAGDLRAWLELAGRVAAGAGGVLATLFRPERATDWRTWVFLYLTFAIGSSISLSGADLEGALTGLVTLAALVLAGNLATLWAGDLAGWAAAAVARWQTVGYVAMAFVLLADAAVALLVLLVPGLVAHVRGRGDG